MAVTIKHAKTDTIADWTQSDLDAQIALGNFPPGTVLADIVLPSDWNNDHTFTGTLPVANGGTGQTSYTDGQLLIGNSTGNTLSKATLTAGSNITITNGAGAITIASTGGGGMTYPGAGIANSTGSAWGTSYTTTGTGTVVALQTSPSLTSPIIDGANPYITFSDGTAVTVAAGRMWYNGTTGSWNLGMGNGNITQQVGEELFIYGKASAAITDSPLQIVYHTGTVGSSGVITFAPTVSGITDENAIIGVATENIALNGFGRVTSFGVIHGINTTGSAFGETWADDDVIWYNPVTGNPTKVKPVAPNIKFQIGIVISAGSGGSGSFQVLLQSGTQLGGTDSNVQITSPTNGQILTYDTSNSYWKNTTLTAGTGISVSAATGGALTVTNSAPDQTVAITGAGGAVVTGTYPNFTITTPSGTVTSVSGTGSVNGITLTGTVTSSGSLTLGGTLGSIANSQLTNSSVTVNGTAIALGASGTVTATATNALTIGTGLSGTSYNGSTAVTIANSAPMTYPSGSGIAVVSSGTSWGTTLTAPSGTIVGTTDTQTLTNKRITSRVGSTTSSATPTINTDNVDMYGLTAQAVDITSFTTNLSGTPTDGQKLWIYIVGTAARAITWGASFESSTVTLPTTTVSTNRLDVGFVWNAATSKWRCVASA